jgi:hypothetical protein
MDERGSIPGRGKKFFSLPQCVQTASGAHASSYPKVPGGGISPGVKLTTHLHLVPRSRTRGAIPPLLQYAFMTWCSVKAQVQLYLNLLPHPSDLVTVIIFGKELFYKL